MKAYVVNQMTGIGERLVRNASIMAENTNQTVEETKRLMEKHEEETIKFEPKFAELRSRVDLLASESLTREEFRSELYELKGQLNTILSHFRLETTHKTRSHHS